MSDEQRFSGTSAGDSRHREYAAISQVAHMYYDLDMLQPEIAERLHFSRSKVSRMLKAARELGIVEISVKQIVDRTASLEKKLCAEFGLKEAVVVSSFEDDEGKSAFRTVTDFAAFYISGLLEGDLRVGISNGRTINEVIKKIRRMKPCNLEVVQVIGSTSNSRIEAEAHLVKDFMDIFLGSGYFLNTPLYIDDVYAKEILLRDPTVRDVFRHMESCDMLLTGIGGLGPAVRAGDAWYGYLAPRHVSELREKGAVGSICAQYYDVNGNAVDCEWNSKCMAMPLEQVRANRMTLGIATGAEKVRPILGALRGGLINVLVTDANTASSVLTVNRRMSASAKQF